MPRDRAYSSALDAPDFVILAVYVVAAVVLVLATKGRLGVPPPARTGKAMPGAE